MVWSFSAFSLTYCVTLYSCLFFPFLSIYHNRVFGFPQVITCLYIYIVLCDLKLEKVVPDLKALNMGA